MSQAYSSGDTEIILGNAIKKLKLPRDEIVVMTKVTCGSYAALVSRALTLIVLS